MADRRGAGQFGITSGDGVANGAMLFIHGTDEITAQRLVRPRYAYRHLDRAGECLNDFAPIIIAACIGDAGMECAVFNDAGRSGGLRPSQPVQRPIYRRHRVARPLHGCDRCDLAFDHAPHADKVDQRLYRRSGQGVQFLPTGIREANEGPAALDRFHAAFGAQHGNRLPNDGAAYVETLGEGIFRRQLGAGNEIVAFDMLDHQARDPLRASPAVMRSACKGSVIIAGRSTH